MTFKKYLKSKNRSRKNICLLLDEDGVLTNRDIDNTKMFNAFFAFVFDTDNGL